MQLTEEENYRLQEVIATLRMEDMTPSDDTIEMWAALIKSEKSEEQVIEELNRKYRHV